MTAPEQQPVTLMLLEGQSEALGPNAGGLTGPDGTTKLRALFTSPDVLMFAGLKRADGASISSASMPLLGGYDQAVDATGVMPSTGVGNIPMGLISAIALKEAGLITDSKVLFHFGGAGGQEVLTFDDDPTTGLTDSRAMALWGNAEFIARQAAKAYGVGNIHLPYFGWHQGAGDRLLARNEYKARFDVMIEDRLAMYRSVLGLTTDPRLMMYQSATSPQPGSPCAMVFDQLDIIGARGGVLVAPSYGIKWNTSDDHPSVQGWLIQSLLFAWAAETPNNWNLMPPVSAPMSNGQMEIAISVRPDETLLADVGRFADYGGDPAHLGLKAVGGGSIGEVTVQADRLIVGTTGTITAIQYAHHLMNAGPHTVTPDAAGDYYLNSRGNLRTSLTRAVNFRGYNLTLERWVPRFEVLVQ
ncbi:hypothetical protein [Paracoccus sphaerophysae]|uniref:Sialate O-acetylesterase domain-containing protein n=1 Tax=Paracoccus sphaerophysae TaxID=690417 RepID=A0A099FFP8_9RHOB|nr:hypothetical protein [Paracoccus sphaerophysae]KGJ09016.1 hypothetical protein IC63_03065 [Paracoccus sphaerophysae]